jgi:hypothetical protein
MDLVGGAGLGDAVTAAAAVEVGSAVGARVGVVLGNKVGVGLGVETAHPAKKKSATTQGSDRA